MSNHQTLDISQIGYDPEYYPRVNGKEDWYVVNVYKDALLATPGKANPSRRNSFPPVVVVSVTTGYEFPYLLLDGLHRVRAFHAAGRKQIAAYVERLPQSQWLRRSVELNVDGKVPLGAGDKRWVAKKLQAGGMENDEIATLLCMTDTSFTKLMASNIERLTQTSARRIPAGRSHRQVGEDHLGFIKAPFSAVSGTANAQRALATQSAVPSRTDTQVLRSFVSLLEARAIDVRDEETLGLLRRAHELLDHLLTA